jgi:hypothetical protein
MSRNASIEQKKSDIRLSLYLFSNHSIQSKMVTTSILHIASSLLLVPYGLLCVYGIKAKLDPDVSETELGGEEQGNI